MALGSLAVLPVGSSRGAGLDAPVRATWTGLPVRDWAARMATLAGTPVIVDRRVDPGIRVTTTCDDETAWAVVLRTTRTAGLAADRLAGSVRIVPPEFAGLAVRAERVRADTVSRLPAARRAAVLRRAAWSWPEAARPRELVAAAAGDLRLEGLERIPHDHLPATTLPPLSLAERLDLVLAHYDLRVAWHPGSGTSAGEIVPIGGPSTDADAHPAARDEPRRQGAGDRPAGVGDTAAARFTLRLEAPLDQALAALAGQLGLELHVDHAALARRGVSPGVIVRADVRDVGREELLEAVLGPLGLEPWISDGRLEVRAATRP